MHLCYLLNFLMLDKHSVKAAWIMLKAYFLFLNKILNSRQSEAYTSPIKAKLKHTMVIAVCSGC